MTETNRNLLEDYLASFGEALSGTGGRRGEIVEEVRTDLMAHVERLVAGGHSEEAAVRAALGEMGNPYELAHHIKGEVPPFGGRTLTVIRYLAASGIIVWALLLLWTFRAWTYGFSPGVIGVVVFFHLPAVLLLWPRIVWRRNWLFGLIPAGLAVVVALAMAVGGTESTGALGTIGDGAPLPPAPVVEETAGDAHEVRTMWIALALSSVTLVLLVAMQQRAQRRTVVLVVLAVVAAVELIFQGEERLFRRDRDRILEFVETYRREKGSYPDAGSFEAEAAKLRSGRVWRSREEHGFQLFWDRPLSSGFAIVYDSDDDRIRVQD